MYQLTRKLRELKPYEPVVGSYAVRLDANESCFDLNGTVKKRVLEKISAIAFNRYPDPLANGVCAAFADYYEINPECVTAGNGSDELISVIAGCFFEKGDTVLTFTPDFSMYAFYSSLYELDVRAIPKNDNMKIDIDNAISYCRENNVKAIIFSNPCNPTSVGVERDDMLRLISSVDCLVIADEAYMDFWDQSIIGRTEDFDNLIVLRTCSKACGLAAVRLGFAVAGRRITDALRAAKSPYNTDSISQAVGEAVFSEKDYLTAGILALIISREALYSGIQELSSRYPDVFGKLYPTCTNFVYFTSKYAREIFEGLLEGSIAVRFFGDSIRINCGNESENAAVLSALNRIAERICRISS